MQGHGSLYFAFPPMYMCYHFLIGPLILKNNVYSLHTAIFYKIVLKSNLVYPFL